MFSEDKGELAVPAVGFLLLGLATLFAAVAIFNAKWDLFEDATILTKDMRVFYILGGLLGLAAFFAFAKAYMVEGGAFGIFAVFLFAYASLPATDMLYMISALALALAAVALILMFMSFRVGDLMVMIIALVSIILFVSVLFAKNTDSFAFIVAGVAFLVIAVVSLITAVLEWLFVQDVALDYADYMYGDDDGCCCDSDCDCGCQD